MRPQEELPDVPHFSFAQACRRPTDRRRAPLERSSRDGACRSRDAYLAGGSAGWRGRRSYQPLGNDVRRGKLVRGRAGSGERNAQRQDRRRSARSRARLRDQLRAGEQLAGAALLSEEEGRRLYLYPTSYVKTSASESVISTINDPGMLTGAKTSFAEQATAFDTVANVYAPYYRQADALTVLSSPLATQNQICAGVPTHDATAAFAYYIEHSNHGRPARQGQPLCRRARRQTARSSCVQHVQRPPVRAGYRRRIPQRHLPPPRLRVLLLRPAPQRRESDPALPEHPRGRRRLGGPARCPRTI